MAYALHYPLSKLEKALYPTRIQPANPKNGVKLRTLLLIAVTLLVVGCGNFRRQWPAVIRHVEGFNAAEQEKVMNALDELNAAGNHAVFSDDPLVGYPIEIKKVPPNPEHPNRVGYAIIRPTGCTVELNEKLFDDLTDVLTSVVWHEVGHCAGLAHVGEAKQVMSAAATAFDRFSNDTLNAFFDQLLSAINN